MVEEVLSAKWNGMFLQRFTSPYFILWLAVLHPKGFLKTRFHPKGLLLSFLISFPFQLQPPLDVTNHSVAREVVTFFTLPPGDYIVVPQTNVPNCDGKFLLRILTDEQSNIWSVMIQHLSAFLLFFRAIFICLNSPSTPLSHSANQILF